jgi:hypothetical protein
MHPKPYITSPEEMHYRQGKHLLAEAGAVYAGM